MSESGLYQTDTTQLKPRTNPRRLKQAKGFMGNFFKSSDQSVTLIHTFIFFFFLGRRPKNQECSRNGANH